MLSVERLSLTVLSWYHRMLPVLPSCISAPIAPDPKLEFKRSALCRTIAHMYVQVDTLQKDAQAVVMAYDGKQQTRKFTQRVQMAVGVELTVVSFGGKDARKKRCL